jgi:glycosyltransferase involved in cell wall biosynthesis/SAM-dependent methyltransferase
VDVKILLVSPYPPKRDGIAAYSAQLAAQWRRGGHRVEVVSPEPSAAHHHTDYRSLRGLLRLLALSYRADLTVVEFYPELFFPSMRRAQFLRHWPFVATLFGLARRLDLVVHEAPYEALQRTPGVRGRVARALWRGLVTLPQAVFVHTEWERLELARTLGLPRERIGLLEHGRSFVKRTPLQAGQARRELGMDDRAFCFLCIGFLQEHKGFDRAVRAFNQIRGDHLRLDIVGSARVPAPEIEAYVAKLREQARASDRVTLHEGFVSDELFDRWLSACDVVVLPYRAIWSSGVLARAALFDKPVIVTDVGGLSEQAGPNATVVRDDLELSRAMSEAAGVSPASDPGAAVPAGEGFEPGSYAESVDLVERRAKVLRSRYEPEAALSDGAGGERLPHSAGEPDSTAAQAGHGMLSRLAHWQGTAQARQLAELRSYFEQMPGNAAALDGRLDDQQRRLAELAEVVEGAKRSVDQQLDDLRGALAWLQHLRGEDRAELASQLSQLRPRPVSQAEPPAGGARQDARVNDHAELTGLYEAHQGRFRGSRESIRRRQEIYLPHVRSAAVDDCPVLDLGPGRGEWLEMLRENGIRAYGVDVNAAFVAAAGKAGLDVRHGDAIEHLRRVPEGSLSAISALHVVEHIPFDALIELVDQSLRALRHGGLLILETPNPLNVLVGASWFYLDPTHVRPIHPDFLGFLLQNRGFVEVQVLNLHPPDEPPLEVPPAGHNGREDGRDTVRRMAELLNKTFFTGMDYGVLGHRANPEALAPGAAPDRAAGRGSPSRA